MIWDLKNVLEVMIWNKGFLPYLTILGILLDLAVKLHNPINITSWSAHLVLNEISEEKEAFSGLFSLPHEETHGMIWRIILPHFLYQPH